MTEYIEIEHSTMIEKAQKEWGEGIVKIGQVYSKEGYQKAKEEAGKFIKYHYNYEDEKNNVLFKPTLASKEPFRMDFEGALSYFVGGNPNYPEDTGFALKPYINVFWDNKGTQIVNEDTIITMGHYYFYDTPDNFVKVEYTFVYLKKGDKDENEDENKNNLKIISQHSSLPYSPKE